MLFAIIIISLVFRIDYLMGNRDYWHDESFQNLYSQKSVSFILDSTDVHPPLFTLITKQIVAINDSVLGTRIFSIICSVLFLISVFFLCKKHFNEITGLIACLFFAVLPTWIHYSVEFRSYMFTLIFVPIQMYFFIEIMKNRTRYNPIMFIFFSWLLLNLHYFTGFYLLGQFIYLLFNINLKDYDELKYYFSNYFYIVLFSIPLFYYLFNTIIKIESFWFEKINLLSLFSSISFTFVQPNLYAFFTFIFILCFTFLLYVIYYECKFRLSKAHLLLFCSYFIPILTLFIISQFKPIYHHRYFLFGGVFIIIFISDLISKIMKEEPVIVPYMISALILIVMLCFASYNLTVDNKSTEIQDSLSFLGYVINNDNLNNSYLLVHTSPFSYTPYIYYSKSVFNDNKNKENINNILLTNLTPEILFTMGGSVIDSDKLFFNEEEINKLIKGNTYIYFISDKAIKDVIIWEQKGLIITRTKSFGMELPQE